MKKEKTFTQSEVYNIIDSLIKETMQNKNKYINLNGYYHKDTLNYFDTRIAAFSELYRLFK